MDPFSVVSDEVALEGLDGITVPSLWVRLETRQPRFPLKLDDSTKELIWRFVSSNPDLKLYQIPEERQDVVLLDRFKDIEHETSKEIQTTHRDTYPVQIILENKDGIQGSCAVFKQRTDITKQIRSKTLTPLLTLEEALERFGRKLVIVASQSLRFRALIGTESDPDLKLSDDSYCVLERVGRARWQGELQKDLHGSSFKIDARKLHYMRKALVRHGLVSMQPHVTRMKSGQQQHSILLLLKRFHINRRSKYDLLMEYASNILQQSPCQFASLMTLRKHLDVEEGTFKRVILYMRNSKLVELCKYPLEDLEPDAGPCINKKGNKVMVRCLKLLKPYAMKDIPDDDDDDDDEEFDLGAKRRGPPSQGRFMERDVLSQAYHLILSTGTRGIPQRGITYQMNVGKLESRMICRRLERDGMIKGFMEDEGRQRTTKFISHKNVGESNHLQRLSEEQERTKLLYSSAPKTPTTAKTASASKATAKQNGKSPAAKKAMKAGGGGGNNGTEEDEKEEEEEEQVCEDDGAAVDGNGGKATGKTAAKGKGRKSGVKTKETQPESPTTPGECEAPVGSEPTTSDAPDAASNPPAAEVGEDEVSSVCPTSPQPQTETQADNQTDEAVVVKDVFQLSDPTNDYRTLKPVKGTHETYRLLRRKNLIVEAVRSSKILEGVFPLQKIIHEDEKQEGVVSKCCKKTILRLVNNLSREGLLKVYKTTIIQDGITKKVEMIVHPSIKPTDDIVNRLIETIRFRIASSYTAVRQAEEKAREQEKANALKSQKNKGDKNERKREISNEIKDFKPKTVRGLGKTFGFQPKMHRLRIIHNFLWYLIYGHPLRQNTADSTSTSQTPANANSPDPEDKHGEKSDDKKGKEDEEHEDEEQQQDTSIAGPAQSDMKVYADEDSWKRFVPPVRVRKEFDSGWAMVGDLLLCLPLSVFIQVIQINYTVDGLEEYLSDPLKQHHLVRALPPRMRRQLLYKRKYIFSFHENLQRLVYMGLMQFGPMEKFKEKDQGFLYLRRVASIVDTTNAEPHYWLVTAPTDKPFDRRQYTFNTAGDVENYWFDLMCVCLNTPLGVIRNKRNVTNEDAPSFVHDRNVFAGLAYLLKGSRDICDDGSIPGDGKGAGGLDSEFFGHLKRNWFWTNHLLSVKTIPSGLEAEGNKIRLKSLLSKSYLRNVLKPGTTTRSLTSKQAPLTEDVEVCVEPASRNQQVVGGKKQKRKRSKKEVVKQPRKKKREPKKRPAPHDEADHKALKMMTRQRVYWSIQEDSLMMLCSVALRLLNSKLKRPYVANCVVRDLLQAEFEISMDKTSLAVGRRSRYILKNPQTLLNFRICLAEVYQDKTLLRQLEEKKPDDPDSIDDCGKAFSEYVRLLRQKFSSTLNICDMVMPDTKQELFSRFNVSAIDTAREVSSTDALECTDDIHSIVLHNLIQSTLAMTNSQMKSSRSFQTFHMYSKYNQELLCHVFIQCRKRGLVNRRRVSQSFGPKKNRALPILPMSYQLSQSYYRCFSWRFPYLLCTDSFRFLRSLINNGTSDDRPVTAFYNETEMRSHNKDDAGSEKKKKQDVGKEGDGVSEENDSAKEGEEMEVSNKETEATSKADGQMKPEGRVTVSSGEDPSAREKTNDNLQGKEEPEAAASTSNPTPGAAQEPPDVSDMLQFSLDSPGGACVVSLSLMSLGLLSVYLSIPKQMVVVDSSLVDNDVVKSMAALEEEDDDDEDDEMYDGKKRLEVKPQQASHTNYMIMRGFCIPGIVRMRNLNINDNIVVESCSMRLQLRDTPAHSLFPLEDSPPLDLTRCGPSLVPPNLTNFTLSSPSAPPSATECERHLVEQRGYTPKDMEACGNIRNSFVGARERGLDLHDLYQTHSDLEEPQDGRTRSLQQYIEDLHEEGQVIRVGSHSVRWVLTQHASPWLLTVNPKQWLQSRPTSNKLPFLENQHNIPFMRKRAFHERSKGEPPAKKAASDRREEKEVEGSSGDVVGEELNEEEQREKPKDGESEEKMLSSEEGDGKTQPEEGEKRRQEGEEAKEEEEKMREEGQEAEEERRKEGEMSSREEGEKTGEEGEEKKEEEKGREEGEKEAGQEKVETNERQQQKREIRTRSKGKQRNQEVIPPTTFPSHVDHEDNVSFISRPWRMVDGSLNRQVCKGMLEAVLYHVMSRPGLTQQSLVEHYKDVLQPMVLLDLVQALLELGCLKKKTLVKSPKPSLFARPAPTAESETKGKVEEADAVFYEPTISCCLRLSQVLPNERHWNCCLPTE